MQWTLRVRGQSLYSMPQTVWENNTECMDMHVLLHYCLRTLYVEYSSTRNSTGGSLYIDDSGK